LPNLGGTAESLRPSKGEAFFYALTLIFRPNGEKNSGRLNAMSSRFMRTIVTDK